MGPLKEDCGTGGPSGAPHCVGDDVYQDYTEVGCAGGNCTVQDSATPVKSCPAGCSGGACIDEEPCSDTFTVTSHACPDYTDYNDSMQGIFEICGTVVQNSGYMTIHARKFDGSSFGTRPYRVRVSYPGDPDCGPNTPYFTVSDSNPDGVGGTQLTFEFQGTWLPGQTEKGFCITASTKLGDMGYDPDNESQESWCWSEKITVTRTCGEPANYRIHAGWRWSEDRWPGECLTSPRLHHLGGKA